MIDIKDPKKLLAAKKCGDIFTNNADKAKEEYRAIVKIYHPDLNKSEEAEDVFKHVGELYTKAENLFKVGIWEMSNCLDFVNKQTGKHSTVKFIKECPFELGMQYISSTVVTYVLEEKNKKYYDNMIKRVGNLKYVNEDMEKEFSKYFPKIIANFETAEGKWVIVVEKTKDVFRLQEVLDYYKGNIPDKHVAWMMSRLNNISRFLEFNGIVHNGISLDNCFVSPEYHSVLLLGGWWYCVDQKEKMLGTQKQIYDIMSPLEKTNKVGSLVTDLESVKLLGRTLLGSIKPPDGFMDWLNSGSSKSAGNEYGKWDEALDKSYGARKFIKMEVGEKEIYGI